MSPARKKKSKRGAETKRTARRVAKRAGKKRARGKGAPKRAAKRTAKPTSRATRRAAKKRPAALHIVPRPAPRRRPRAAHAPAFPQRAGAPAKQIVLFELVRARAAVHAAVGGLTPGKAEQPLGPGKWNARETVLHLVTRDQARLREMEAALQGVRASWEGFDDPRMARENEELMAPLRALTWDDALRLLHLTRQEMLEAVESVPEEPAEVWSEEHAFGWMFQRLPDHDRHHADIIKRWRAETGA